MYRSILVPVDLDQPSSWEKALPTAVALCKTFGAKLSLASVVPERAVMLESQWSPIAYREMMEAARSKLGSPAAAVEGVGDVAHHVECGGIYATILSIGELVGADLRCPPRTRARSSATDRRACWPGSSCISNRMFFMSASASIEEKPRSRAVRPT